MSHENILERISSLLNMTEENGCTESEATNAATLAMKLMLRYGMSIEQVKDSEIKKECGVEIVELSAPIGSGQSAKSWAVQLSCTIAQVHCCEALYSKTKVYFIGERNNANAASKLYTWLSQQAKNICGVERYKAYEAAFKTADHHIGRNWTISFMVGLIARLNKRLLEEFVSEVENLGAQSFALAKVDKAREYIDNTYPDLKEEHASTPNINFLAYLKGIASADQMVLRQNPEITKGN